MIFATLLEGISNAKLLKSKTFYLYGLLSVALQLNTQALSSIYFSIFHFLENLCNGVCGQNKRLSHFL